MLLLFEPIYTEGLAVGTRRTVPPGDDVEIL
jgi:hypothetical protein